MRAPGTVRRALRRGDAAVLGGAAGLLALTVWWGHQLLPTHVLYVAGPPFQGTYRVLVRAAVPGLVLAPLLVAALPVLARRLPWRLLLVAATGLAAAWAVALAVWDGHDGIAGPIDRGAEYLYALPAVGDSPGTFLSGFADDVANRRLPTHVNGHPPLMVLVFWAWARIGLDGGGWAAALVIGAGASATAALAVTLRALGQEPAARRAVPFLVLGPFAITIATSADAFFLGVAAWSAAALAVALRRRSVLLLLVGGVLAGSLPYLSYGLLPFGAVLLTVAVLAARVDGPGRDGPGRDGPGRGRRGRGWRASAGPAAPLAVAYLGGLAVVPLLMTAGGFWWPEGVAATHHAWSLGKGDDRPYFYAFLADLSVLTVLVGPATLVAARRVGRGVVAALAGSALVGVLALDLAGVTRLEVERIWLPWAPWMVLVTAALPGRGRGWLAAQAALAICFQLLVKDVW